MEARARACVCVCGRAAGARARAGIHEEMFGRANALIKPANKGDVQESRLTL